MFVISSRSVILRGLLLAFVLGSSHAVSAQEEAGLSWRHHDWGRFPIGSWQKIRITTDTIGPNGEVTGSTEKVKITEFVGGTRRAVTLRTSETVNVAGKQFAAPSSDVNQGSLGIPVAQSLTSKDLGESKMQVGERDIPCRVREYSFTDGEAKKIVKIYYSDRVAPFVLKREEVSTTAQQTTCYKNSVDVLAFDMPHKVLAEIMPTSYVKQVHENGKATTTTLAVHAQDVPGGIVAYTSRETDANGKLIRRSKAELVDYGFSAHDGNGGVRRFPRRIRWWRER